jgi:hypothetical protein
MSEKPVSEIKSSGEIDMSDFLKLLGKGFTKVGNGISWFFVSLYQLIISFFLFIKRKFIWLAIGFVLGLGWGLYSYYNSAAIYSSEMITRSNYESNYYLYTQIGYYNSLIRNHRFKELATEFKISEDEAQNLVIFKIEPIKNNIEAAKLFRQTFLQFKRNHTYGFDTAWSRTMKFDIYKKELSDIDYPLNTILLRSKSQDIFPKIQEGIINSLNNNPDLKEKKEAITQIRKQEEELLSGLLSNLDTLRQVYNKKLAAEAENKTQAGNQFVFGERNIKNPELDLYDKAMLLKDELIELRMMSAGEKNILELDSGFGKNGTRESVLRKMAMPIIYVLSFVFLILIAIEFIRYLNRVEKNKALLSH